MIYLFWTYQFVPNSLYFLQNNLIKILEKSIFFPSTFSLISLPDFEKIEHKNNAMLLTFSS